MITFAFQAVQDDLLLISQRQVPVPRNLKTLENHIAFTSNKPSLVGQCVDLCCISKVLVTC